MIYQIFKPLPQLAELVDYYWYLKTEPCAVTNLQFLTPLHQGLVFNFCKSEVLHSFDGKLIQHLKQGYFFGQPISPRVATWPKNGIDIIAVKFKPLGLVKLTGIPMHLLANNFLEAEELWGSEFEILCQKMQAVENIRDRIDILEKFLCTKYIKQKQLHFLPQVANAIKLINQHRGTKFIKEICPQTNTTPKTLERHFMQAIGLTPKCYAQIVRFNAAKTELNKCLPNQKISDVAKRLGFYSPSHFTSEFKHFAGLTPKQYLLHKIN